MRRSVSSSSGSSALSSGGGVARMASARRASALPFRVASTTKGMTALLVAQFVDDGRLAWDQPVREVWRAFRTPTPELTAALRGRPRKEMP